MRSLLLAFVSLASAWAACAQPVLPANATAVDSMLARIGTTVDGSEKAYFGLFPDVPLSSFDEATLEPMPSGEMHVIIHRPRGDEERRLSPDVALMMSRYVTYYEALRAPGATAALRRIDREMTLAGLGRHAYERSSLRSIEVGTRDGQTIRGWLLFADYERLILHTSDRPLDLWNLDTHTSVVAAPNILRVGRTTSRLRRALPYLEAGVGLAAQRVFAQRAYDGNADLGDAGAAQLSAVVSAITAGSFGLLNRQLREKRPTPENVSLMTRRMAPRAFFAQRSPAEFVAWLSALPAAPLPAPLPPEPPRRARWRVHVMAAAPYRAAPDGIVTRNASATLRGRQIDGLYESVPRTASGRGGGELVVNPIRLVHVGGEMYWNRTLDELPALVVGRDNGDVLNRPTPETLIPETEWAAFAGVSLGDGSARWLRSRIEVSGGVAYRGQRVSSSFPVTLATPEVRTVPPDFVQSYRAEQSGHHPYGRIVYDFFATPVTSLSFKATYVPQSDFVIGAQEAAYTFSGNSWAVDQPEHTYTFSPWSLSFGLRTHL